MTPFEKFEQAKKAVLDTREELTDLRRRPNDERHRQLLDTQERRLKSYRAAEAELRAGGQPLTGVDFLR